MDCAEGIDWSTFHEIPEFRAHALWVTVFSAIGGGTGNCSARTLVAMSLGCPLSNGSAGALGDGCF